MVPQVSIIMPLYNKATEVLGSVASVRAQTVTDWELIVVDDGSSDGGADLVHGLADQRIKIIKQSNQGVSLARNRGLLEAESPWIAFLDADDEWRSDYLATILSLARDYPQAPWLATGYEIRHPREGVFNARLRGITKGFRRGILRNYFTVATKSDPPVWSSAVVVRRKILLEIGGFPAGIASGEDLLTWARLAVRYPLAYDVRPMAVFNVSGNDRRADPNQKVTAALKELLRTYPSIPGLRNYLGLWNRIQAVMALRYGEIMLARREAWQAILNAPWQWRSSYTLVLALFPHTISMRLDLWLRRSIH